MKHYSNKKFKWKDFTFSAKFLVFVLVFGILFVIFSSIYGGVHALKDDCTAYADTTSTEQVTTAVVSCPAPSILRGSSYALLPYTFYFYFNMNNGEVYIRYYDNNEDEFSTYVDTYSNLVQGMSFPILSDNNGVSTPYRFRLLTTNTVSISSIEYLYASYYSSNEFRITFDCTLVNSSRFTYTFIFDDGATATSTFPFVGNTMYHNEVLIDVENLELMFNYQSFYDNAYKDGYEQGIKVSNQQEYNRGKQDGIASASDYSFYALLDAIFYAPAKFIYSLFSFDVLGVNMYGFFITLISVGVVAFILRLVL